ncbi:hypothetical protein OSTOST_25716, partial [Ostertagia ostertagi]
TRERKRKSGSSSEDSLVIPPPVPAEALVIPPPLPKLEERQELQSLTHADFLERDGSQFTDSRANDIPKGRYNVRELTVLAAPCLCESR